MILVAASGWTVVAFLPLTLRAKLLRKPKQSIHVFLQGGTNDLGWEWGNQTLADFEMAATLKFKGYDYKFVLGDGAHVHFSYRLRDVGFLSHRGVLSL